MFLDICNHRKTPALARFSLYCWNVISLDFNLSLGTFPIVACFLRILVYNLLSPFINTVLSFPLMWILSVWLDSKYNVRRCDVLVQNKTIHSLNLAALDLDISLKIATWAIGKTFRMIRGRVVCIIVFIISIFSPNIMCFVDDLCQILKECFHLIVLVA